MTLELEALSHERLVHVSLSLARGLHVVLGTPADGTLELLQLCAGEHPPRRGRVRLNGYEPHRHPPTRSAIGTALGDDAYPDEHHVGTAVERRLRQHGCTKSAAEALGRLDSTVSVDRNPKTLTTHERQSVALATALALERPKALLLHEPLGGVSPSNASKLLAILHEHAEAAIVLCTTQSPRVAAHLSPQALLLEDGRFKRATLAPTGPAFAPGSPARVRVRSSDSKRLANALAEHPAVDALCWDARTATLIVEGKQVEALCQALLHIALEQGVIVNEMTQALPEHSEIRATHAALAQRAFERAWRGAAHPTSDSAHEGRHG